MDLQRPNKELRKYSLLGVNKIGKSPLGFTGGCLLYWINWSLWNYIVVQA